MVSLITFETREELANQLAIDVQRALNDMLNTADRATLAVSGGRSPRMFFDSLSKKQLPWERVTISPADERFVPEDNDRSNAKLIRERLIKEEAKLARFESFYRPDVNLEELEVVLNSEALHYLPPAVCILGMGLDGHTASLFPEGDRLNFALDKKTETNILTLRAPGALEPRITLTLSAILKASFLALHIEGHEKLNVLKKATEMNDSNSSEQMPIGCFFSARPSIPVYWAP